MENELAQEVRRLSYNLGINLSELSRRANVDRSTITRWMNGDGDIMAKNLESILKVLNIELRFIVSSKTIELVQPLELDHGTSSAPQ